LIFRTPLNINVTQIPVADAGPDDSICEGDNASLNASGGANFLWNTGSTVSSFIVSPMLNTIYTVTISNGACLDTDNVMITVFGKPIANAGVNTTILLGGNTTLTATGGTSYSWQPSQGLSCVNCPNPIANPTLTTLYTVIVTNADGCTSIDTIRITVIDECLDDLFIPTAFSPNSDGQNDLYFLNGTCIKNFIFTIYDRWGETVFETNDISQIWDGTFRGKTLNTQVLAYIFNAELFGDKKLSKSGNISLVR